MSDLLGRTITSSMSGAFELHLGMKSSDLFFSLDFEGPPRFREGAQFVLGALHVFALPNGPTGASRCGGCTSQAATSENCAEDGRSHRDPRL